MKTAKNKLAKKILAITLSILMVFGLIPGSVLTAMAATTEYPDAVSVSGIDEENNPVVGATAAYSIITDVTVTAETVPYDGNSHPIAVVSGTENTDVVKYQLGDETTWKDVMPEMSAVGTYVLTVSVEREGYDPFINTVTGEVTKGTINLEAEAYAGNYDGMEHEAVTIKGGTEAGDVITYSVDGSVYTAEVPKVKDVVDAYQVWVRVQRNENYNEFVGTYTAKVTATDISGLKAALYSGTYDKKPHPVVEKVEGTIPGDIVEYKLNDGPWTTAVPSVTDAGIYTVAIRVIRNNYNTTEIIDLSPAAVTVAQAEQRLEFDNYTGDSSTVTLKGLPPFDAAATEKYDFSATDKTNYVGQPITYAIDFDDPDDVGMAEINSTTGELTVLDAGTVTVTATLSGDANYRETTIFHKLTVDVVPASTGQFISFAEAKVSYIFGEKDGVAAEQTANKANTKITGTITYEMDQKNIGLSCDKKNGKITITDYTKLSETLEKNDGALEVLVTATKSKTKKHGEDKAAYIVTVSYAETPEETCEIVRGTMGNNGWYQTDIEVSAVNTDGYYISRSCDPKSFTERVTFNEQGFAERYVYLKDKVAGGITGKILLDKTIKIDTVKPDAGKIGIAYSEEKNVIDKIFHFYNSKVTITFTAYDETSGIDYFDWEYTRTDDASLVNLEKDSGRAEAVEDKDEKGNTVYKAEITLPKEEAQQLKGYLSVTAADKAGLESDKKTDDGKVIIVDTISPKMTASYELTAGEGTVQETDGQKYFSGEVTCTFNVEEANFYAEDVLVSVSKDEAETVPVKVSWDENPSADDMHIGTFTLSEDGDYKVYVTYMDRSTNTMSPYESALFTVDNIDPTVTFSYADYTDETNPQAATVTITEHNFRKADIEVQAEAKDLNGKDVFTEDLQKYLREECVGRSWRRTYSSNFR